MAKTPEDVAVEVIELAVEALKPLGFQPVVVDVSGDEPFVSYDLGDSNWLDVTAKVFRV